MRNIDWRTWVICVCKLFQCLRYFCFWVKIRKVNPILPACSLQTNYTQTHGSDYNCMHRYLLFPQITIKMISVFKMEKLKFKGKDRPFLYPLLLLLLLFYHYFYYYYYYYELSYSNVMNRYIYPFTQGNTDGKQCCNVII